MSNQNTDRRLRLTVLAILLNLLTIQANSQGVVSRIYTDFNNYWTSSIASNNPVRPNTSHHLLAFSWGTRTFSTGVKDSILNARGVSYLPKNFRAFPISSISTGGPSNYVAIGAMNDGIDSGISSPAPFPTPVTGAIAASMLTDGIKGLNLGTGIANIPAGALTFTLSEVGIDPNAINDSVPDVVVTQIAQPSSTLDKIYFVDAAGNTVGTKISIDHTTANSIVGNWVPDFYTLTGGPGIIKSDRGLILWAVDLVSFGITTANVAQAVALKYELSGQSDVAFVAYNVPSISIATELVLTTQPNTSVVAACCSNINSSAFAQSPVIQVQDGAGHNIAQSGTLVTATIAAGPTGYGTLGGTTVVTTNASGQATFSNLVMPCTPGQYTLRFTAGSLDPGTSVQVTVNKAVYYPTVAGALTLSSLSSWNSQANGTGSAPTDFGAGKEFILNNSAGLTSFSTGGNWTMAGQLTIPSGKTLSVTAATTTTLSCDINQGGTMIGAVGSSLVLNGSQLQTLGGTNSLRSLTINNPSGVMLSNNLTITNALTLTSGIFDIGNNTLDIAGTITRIGGSVNASGTNAIVNFSGIVAQSIPSNAFSGKISNLRINNLLGVTIGSNLQIGNLVTLTNGKLVLGNFNLTTPSISGATAINYIQTNGTGRLRLGVTTSATFPVGNSFYNPVTVTNNTGVSDTFAVRVLNEVLSNGLLGLTVTIPRISATWDISKTLANGGSGYDMLFNWQPVQNLGVISPVLFNYQGSWLNQPGAILSPTATSMSFNAYVGSSPLFAISDNAVVLPLTWTAFNLQKVGDKVKLSWETENEVNTKDFTVLRNNGNNDWKALGTLPALAGNKYSFTDNQPLDGVNNYRIRQSDKDGKYSFSDMRTIALASSEMLRVVNPVVNGKMNFTLSKTTEVSLVDASGRKIWTKQFAAGSHQSNVSGLGKGIYILKTSEMSARVYIP